MDAKELLSMFKAEFEKNIPVLLEVKERIVGSQGPEDLELALETYVLMLQRICEGASALGLNGVYLYLQTICLNVYEAKSLSVEEQDFIGEMYVFWAAPLTAYLDAAIGGGADDVAAAALAMLEELAPPNALLPVDEVAFMEMLDSLQKVMDVDVGVQRFLDEVTQERQEVFSFDDGAFDMDWGRLDRGAVAGLLAECQENLEVLERGMSACEALCAEADARGGEPSGEELRGLIAESQRAAHTIKGSSQMGGLPRLALLLHKVEDLFDFAASPAGSWRLFLRPGLTRWCRLVVEEAGKLVESLIDAGFEPSADVSRARLINFLACLDAAMSGGDEPEGLLDAPVPSEAGAVALGSERPGAEGAMGAGQGADGGTGGAGREASAGLLTSLFEGISNSRIRVNHIKTQNAALVGTLKAAKQENEELNKKLDELARFVSAHLLEAGGRDSLEKRNYSEVYTMCVSIGETNNNMKLLLGEVDGSSLRMGQQIESVEKNERNLSHEVLRAQMVEFSSVAGRLKRVVSGAAEACGKEVSYSMEGGATLIEKGVLDKLRDPLMHLLRNAIDHGMEGKEGGRLALRAESFGNKVRVQVEDDGAGVDLEAVKAKAVEKGIVGREEAERMDGDELRGLIFESGFSTKSAVTEMSGRGVGLDVVKRNVESLGGSVAARAREGGGTVFEMLIPSNMSSVNCLVVRHAGGYYAVPTSFIAKILEPGAFAVTRMEAGSSVHAEVGEEGAQVEWERVGGAAGGAAMAPAMNFKAFAMVSGAGGKARGREREQRAGFGSKRMKALMLRFGRAELAVLVEETLFIEDMIVRKTHALGRAARYVLGTTILLNGEIVPILNVGELMEARGSGAREAELEAGADLVKVLVVDDSLFMRDFLEQEVEAMGYDPVLAINGLDAVRKLAESGARLVLTDLEMPEMDGFELTKFIKRSEAHKNLPVFLVTSRSTDRYRQQAKEAGVDEFVSKPFDVEDLERRMAAALKT